MRCVFQTMEPFPDARPSPVHPQGTAGRGQFGTTGVEVAVHSPAGKAKRTRELRLAQGWRRRAQKSRERVVLAGDNRRRRQAGRVPYPVMAYDDAIRTGPHIVLRGPHAVFQGEAQVPGQRRHHVPIQSLCRRRQFRVKERVGKQQLRRQWFSDIGKE